MTLSLGSQLALPWSWIFLEILDFFLYVQDKIKHIYFDIFDNIFLTTDQRYDNLM